MTIFCSQSLILFTALMEKYFFKFTELRKNCDEIIGRRRLYDHYPLKSGFYTIDPDGLGGAEPFKVQCKSRVTFIGTRG